MKFTPEQRTKAKAAKSAEVLIDLPANVRLLTSDEGGHCFGYPPYV